MILCREVSDFLESKNCTVTEVPLIYNESNDFPFNIKADFPAELRSSSAENDSPKTVLIVFRTEDAYKERNTIGKLIDHINSEKRNYNLELLFTYEDIHNSNLPKARNIIKGSSVFIENMDTADEYCAVCISFIHGKNAVIPGSGGDVSPSWLVRCLIDALSQSDINFDLKGGSLSSLYRLRILQDDTLTAGFLNAEIPSAGINFSHSSDENDENKYAEGIANFLRSYSEEASEDWDRHAFMVKIGNTRYWAGEQFTVILFIAAAFLSLFILCELSFTVHPRRNEIRKDVLDLWYILPLTVLATTVFFAAGQGISLLLFKLFSIDPYTRIAVKAITGFILISFAFIIIIRLQGILSESAYSYLLTLAAMFNIILYSAVDISLFYLFAAEYIIAALSKPARRTVALAVIFVLMMTPFIPYAVHILKYAEPDSFVYLASSPFHVNLFISSAFLPFEILWLRILARLNKIWTSADSTTKRFRRQNLAAIGGAVGIFTVILITVTNIIPDRYKNRKQPQNTAEIQEISDGLLKITYDDYSYFGETARILTIELGMQAEQCTVEISAENSDPIIYSDEPYISDNINMTDSFLLPLWPPENLSFKYIADSKSKSAVTVTALYPEENKNSYSLRKQTINIPASKKAAQQND